jgi:dienelactone hydrolase
MKGGVQMAEVVLFHSVLGLRPGVIAAADRLRTAGHTVHTPDLFDGEVFEELDDGMRKEEALDYREITRRAREAVGGLPEELVYAGFSMGATHAERCWPPRGRAPWGRSSCTAPRLWRS